MNKAPKKVTAKGDSCKFLKEIAGKAYCGIAVAAVDGAVEFINPAMRKFFGIKATDVATIQGWAELVFPERKERQKYLSMWNKFASGEDIPEGILSFVHYDGNERRCRFRLKRMKDGRVIIYIDETTADRDPDLLPEQYHYTMDNLSGMILWIDPDANFIYVNNTVCNALGYSREQMMGMAIHDIDSMVTKKGWPAAWKHLKKQGVVTLDTMLMRKDGSMLPVELVARYCKFAGKEYSFAFATDASERKKADTELLDSEMQYRSMIESAPIGMHIYRLEADGRLIFLGANPAADRMLGVTYGQFKGKVIEEVFPSLANTEIPARYRDIAGKGGHWFMGELDYSDARCSGVFDVHAFQTLPNMMVAAFLDVSERRKTASELRQRAAAVTSAAESICITDCSGNIIYANPAFEVMTGYSLAEVVGKNTRIFKSGKHDSKFYAQLWSTILNGDTWRGNFINMKRDGTLFEESAVISPVRGDDGKIINFVAVKRDVTLERILEEQVRQSQKMAAIGQLAHRVAHNFTNILVIILGNAQLAKAVLPQASEAGKYIGEVINAANRVSALTAELIAFAHPAELRLQIMRLDKALLGIEDILRATIAPRIQLTIDLSSANFKVNIDPIQIEQAILHMAINADEAMDGERPELSIHAGPSELGSDFAVITVTDNGPGISDEMQKQMFDPFTTTKSIGTNPGLGLATVYGIINRHGGFINVDSTIGKGTSFKVYLPRCPQDK